jgi:hypothetical protein
MGLPPEEGNGWPSGNTSMPLLLPESGRRSIRPASFTPGSVMPDSKTLLMISTSGTAGNEITVVLNWFEELKRKMQVMGDNYIDRSCTCQINVLPAAVGVLIIGVQSRDDYRNEWIAVF